MWFSGINSDTWQLLSICPFCRLRFHWVWRTFSVCTGKWKNEKVWLSQGNMCKHTSCANWITWQKAYFSDSSLIDEHFFPWKLYWLGVNILQGMFMNYFQNLSLFLIWSNTSVFTAYWSLSYQQFTLKYLL